MKRFPTVLYASVLLAGWSLQGVAAGSASPDVAAVIDTIATKQDARVAAALARIDGTGRRLLALRAYLRAGNSLVERWSWSNEQIAAFAQSAENRAMQAEIEKVRGAFTTANPGFQLWVNPEVRSLDVQLANWNHNDSVTRAAARLLEAFDQWRQTAVVAALSVTEIPAAAGQFLADSIPSPTPTLAAPGLSPHGQMRAIDFHIKQGGRTVAGPASATIARDWDAAGWARKLAAAVSAGSSHFTGPLPVPREPWHYTYVP
ncbi:MAG: hypothetical protein WDO12_11105 [Pseudomonadota bacterium]